MKKIKLITYMRKNEYFNEGIEDVCNIINGITDSLECVVFTDSHREFVEKKFKINNIISSGTKYSRLLKLINEEDEDCLYISVDNDMIFNQKVFKKYIADCLSRNVDFSWARLQSQKCNGVISKLVAIDKLLSHNIIRPVIWRLGLGLSIPGQCFVLNPKAFKNKLYKIDTFLDDLALGAFVNENYSALNVYTSKDIIGYEYPNSNFWKLCKQRKRWAKGFYQVLNASKGKEIFGKVCFHGLVYHCNWIINWLIVILLVLLNVKIAGVYILLVALIITYREPQMLFWGVIYQFIFPIFHVVWIYYLIKGENNLDNG